MAESIADEAAKTMRRVILTTLLFAAAATVAQAQPKQSLADIRARVQAYVTAQADGPGRIERIEIDRLDKRLRLPACGVPLRADTPTRRAGSDRLVVRVRCPAPSAWKVYVPTRVVRSVAVVVTTRPVPRGSRLDEPDLRLGRRTSSRLRGKYYTDPNSLIGLQARRALSPDTVVDAGQLTQATLVRRGDKLLIQAGSGAVRVSMQGQALEDGTRGERIRARNLSSERIVEGEVIAHGRMRIEY